ncbi:agmatine/peptidylarginine deiminase [uncultured Eudoraea sp.]|uniref:agmatine deiminase family protein n=1 Tax=uncultured Eudoraea sp. TaxID=1035614 RepID=UPI002610A8D5|nr:agmatine deiminase family protein [uncultured Eudoraea sp.]
MPNHYKAIHIIYPALVLALTLLFSGCNSHPDKNKNLLKVTRQMGEFEEIDALWLIWPTTDHKSGESVEEVTLAIIEALVSDLKIVISCADDKVLEKAKSILNEKYPASENLIFKVIPSMEIWARDMGPSFVELKNGNHAIADFNFNSWGYADTLDFAAKTEEKFDERVAEILNLPLISSAMISEGGNRELNGKGTLLVSETVEQGRNPTMTKAAMEAEYQRLLGVKKVIWLQHGLLEDSHTFLGPLTTADNSKAYTVVTTNGHVDEFARFVNDSTVLLASVDSTDMQDPIAGENHRRMEENFKILSMSTDQDGNPFNIIRMPLPPTILSTMQPGDYVYDYIQTLDYQDGSQFPNGEVITVAAAASYLNFIITTEVIVGQKYWRKGMPDEIQRKDEETKMILESVFPNRKVVMIDALAVNLGGGGLHCISMHQPVLNGN